jgi:hypothetical protein
VGDGRWAMEGGRWKVHDERRIMEGLRSGGAIIPPLVPGERVEVAAR